MPDTLAQLVAIIVLAIATTTERARPQSSVWPQRHLPPSPIDEFEHVDSQWTERQELSAPVGESGECFGKAIGLSDDLLVVGAPGENGWTGACYLYRIDGANWTLEQRLTATDDVDANGVLNNMNVAMIQGYLAGCTGSTAECLMDVNSDFRIDQNDVDDLLGYIQHGKPELLVRPGCFCPTCP